ncbi:MAG: lytic transglycosylase domain-containing protein [Candidatus Moranbacteria bacterium]|nr:lytic transglycosylase domain-containing protein [Candidatus Moranbacteria bacterium]
MQNKKKSSSVKIKLSALVALLAISFLFHNFALATPDITSVNPNSTASTGGPYKNQEKIPGAQPTDQFIQYLKDVINFGFAVIGILALFMLVIGAYQYLMAAGSGNAADAKETIISALLGLVLGLTAWIILNTINPDLVKMNPITQIQGAGGNVSYSGVGTATNTKYGTVAVSGTIKERIAQYDAIIKETSQKYPNVSEALIKAVIDQESEGKADAVNAKSGCTGLMQLDGGKGVADRTDPRQNIMGGTGYLSSLLTKYNGNEENALRAYNWGEGNMDAYLKTGFGKSGNPMPAETVKFAPEILGKVPIYAIPAM